MEAGHLPGAYLAPRTDRVREEFEAGWLAEAVAGLLPRDANARVLDLGCGGGLGPLLARRGLGDYMGVDFRSPGFELPGPHVLHDLRDGLGPVGREPFDLYVAAFGLASHLSEAQLRRLLAEIAAHARPGAAVAIEALGLLSLEWPRLWHTSPGDERTLAYAMDRDVRVHPWAAAELHALMSEAGIAPTRVLDRSLQAGPKLDDGRYWPGLPPLRGALNTLLHPQSRSGAQRTVTDPLWSALPPLPAGRAAAVHQRLATRRRRLVAAHEGTPAGLARAVWALERGSGGGFGHGLLVLGRVA